MNEEHEVNWKKQTNKQKQKFKNNAMSLVHIIFQFFNRMAQESRGNKLENERRKDLKMKKNRKNENSYNWYYEEQLNLMTMNEMRIDWNEKVGQK